MATVRIEIDGKELLTRADQTIMEACREIGINIPALCHDAQLKPLGSCQICIVEVQGHGLVASCATRVADGMAIQTINPGIAARRRQCLESLLADHYGDCVAPCQLACPAGVDAQGYIAYIARGAYKEAVELIMETLPLPGVIGRICPHPCEQACRRNLVDQPISICSLKRFAADSEIQGEDMFAPALKPRTGFRVAIVGSGPAGLSAAYYLTLGGHEVTVFEALPEPGGMLRYGIPEYRLPKDVLRRESDRIAGLGVAIKTDQALGRDFTIEGLLQDGFGAIFIAIGAHRSQRMEVEGEDLEGVLPGTDFLRSVALGKAVELGRRVAVIGGGNTAIDAARTARRLGAEEISIIYRRSRTEMPAAEWEVEEAEEEGIGLHFLAAPLRILGSNGRVSALECIRMALGEPDASGRRRPEPIPRSEFVVAADSVIAAIGQRPDLSFLAGEAALKAERGNLVADPGTSMTDVPGVFAGGDAVTGPATAVEAIAAGRKAAIAIDRYLKGEELLAEARPFNIGKGQLKELAGRGEFARVEHRPRAQMPRLRPDERWRHFEEMELGYPEDMARREAERCLECGCKAAHDCALRELATEYGVPDITARKDRPYYPLDKAHPFVERDPNKCISCERCARICLDVMGIGALAVNYRVGTTEGYGGPLLNTTCVSCGQCVTSCPVGALVSKNSLPPAAEVRTVCPYCGVGCGTRVGIRGDVIVNVRGDPESPVNKGNLCVKGRFGIIEVVHSPQRLTTPLIRRGDGLVEAGWDEALDMVAANLGRYQGDEVAVLASAKCTNEENYLIQKFARAVLGTNNVDHCARLCHAPSVVGLAQSFGSGAMTNSIEEIGDAATILAIGTNTTAAHPVLALQIIRAVSKGSRLIVANPRRIELCKFADMWLSHRPGSDVALIMGMMRAIVDEGLEDRAFIAQRCENYEAFVESLRSFTPDFVAEVTGVPWERIAEAARLFATNPPSTILYAMGITQHSHGTDNVLALANLAMLTGNLGKPSSGVNPLRGHNNVQGSCDMGALPNVFPGYQRVDDAAVRRRFEEAWGTRLPESPGLTLTEILNAAYQRQIEALYLVGENPALSEPCARHAQGALEELEFLVVQDIFLSETAQRAHVVLPACTFAEREGTFTNTERRVQRIRQAIKPLKDSRPDWWIICEIARRMGATGFDFSHPGEVMAEVSRLTPSYGGISYSRLERDGLQWPCPDEDHPGTRYLHQKQFVRGRGRFLPLEYRPPAELPDEEYPLILTSERSLYQYHTGTMTRKVAGLNALRGEEWVEMHPGDAQRLGIADGDAVKVTSRRGEVVARAKVTEVSPPGVVSMTFHFAESPTNMLTNPVVDPVAKIPELKVCAVKVEKCSEAVHI